MQVSSRLTDVACVTRRHVILKNTLLRLIFGILHSKEGRSVESFDIVRITVNETSFDNLVNFFYKLVSNNTTILQAVEQFVCFTGLGSTGLLVFRLVH